MNTPIELFIKAPIESKSEICYTLVDSLCQVLGLDGSASSPDSILAAADAFTDNLINGLMGDDDMIKEMMTVLVQTHVGKGTVLYQSVAARLNAIPADERSAATCYAMMALLSIVSVPFATLTFMMTIVPADLQPILQRYGLSLFRRPAITKSPVQSVWPGILPTDHPLMIGYTHEIPLLVSAMFSWPTLSNAFLTSMLYTANVVRTSANVQLGPSARDRLAAAMNDVNAVYIPMCSGANISRVPAATFVAPHIIVSGNATLADDIDKNTISKFIMPRFVPRDSAHNCRGACRERNDDGRLSVLTKFLRVLPSLLVPKFQSRKVWVF